MSDEVFSNKINVDVSDVEKNLTKATSEVKAFETAVKNVENVKIKDPLSPTFSAELNRANSELTKTKQALENVANASKEASVHASGLGSKLMDVGKTMLGVFGGNILTGLFNNLGGSLLSWAKNAQEASVANVKLNAVLESTKGASGMTRESLDKLTASLKASTGISAGTIKEAEHMLLTFTNIGKDTFPKATETVLNLSTAMGSDAKSAAIQLGKALNDPTKGMTALQRVGVAFTAEQKAQIQTMQASGDMMGAQAIILKELDTEFGGLAKSVGANRSPMEKMQEAFKGITTEIGAFVNDGLKVAMPVVEKLAAVINNAMPKIISFLTDLKDSIIDGFTPIYNVMAPLIMKAFDGIIAALGWLFGLFKDPIFQTVVAIIAGIAIGVEVVTAGIAAWAAIQAILNGNLIATQIAAAAAWLAAIGPIGWIIIGLVALGAAVVVLWNKFDWFRIGVKTVWEYIQYGALEAWNYIKLYFVAPFEAFIETIKGAGKILGKVFSGDFKGAIDEVGNTVKKVGGSIKDNINNTLKDSANNAKSLKDGLNQIGKDEEERAKNKNKKKSEETTKPKEYKTLNPDGSPATAGGKENKIKDATQELDDIADAIKKKKAQIDANDEKDTLIKAIKLADIEEQSELDAVDKKEAALKAKKGISDAQKLKAHKLFEEERAIIKKQGEQKQNDILDKADKENNKAEDATQELDNIADAIKKKKTQIDANDEKDTLKKAIKLANIEEQSELDAVDKKEAALKAKKGISDAQKLKAHKLFEEERAIIKKQGEQKQIDIVDKANKETLKKQEQIAAATSQIFADSLVKNEGIGKAAQKAVLGSILDMVKQQIMLTFPAILTTSIGLLGPIAGPIAAGLAEGAIQASFSLASNFINRQEGGETPGLGFSGNVGSSRSVLVNLSENNRPEYVIRNSSYEKFKDMMPIINSGSERQLSEYVINRYGHLVNSSNNQQHNYAMIGVESGISETNKRLDKIENAIMNSYNKVQVKNTFSPLKLENGEIQAHIIKMKKESLRHGC